jgi:predicted nuclease of predicted toxin-antitoxin system
VTFDQDYIALAALRGAPPKIILVRSGNMSTLAIAHLLGKYLPRIMEFTLGQAPEGMAVLELP